VAQVGQAHVLADGAALCRGIAVAGDDFIVAILAELRSERLMNWMQRRLLHQHLLKCILVLNPL
jgi:hypothetical protein